MTIWRTTVRLNELLDFLNEQTMTQDEMKSFYERLTSEEKTYQKKQLTFDVEIAREPKQVITVIDGKAETTNKASKGDYILTGTKGERYVLSPEKFKKRYALAGNKAKTKPVKIKAKEYTESKPEKFLASWGEEMILENGDFLVNNNGEFYRIEKGAFHNTYELVKS